MKRYLLLLLAHALLPLSGWAALSFAPIFNDGAVLQCQMKCNLWGVAAPGARVDITVDGAAAASTTADAAGVWQAVLDPREPGGPHGIEVKSDTESAKLADVWFGEVWIASGQSNMKWALDKTAGGPEALQRTEPGIRFVIVPRRNHSQKPPTLRDLQWSSFAPATSANFSAVAFHFADRLQAETGRKVGIVQSAVGGTPAQAWTPLAALEAAPELSHYAEEVRKAASTPPAAQTRAEPDAPGDNTSNADGPGQAKRQDQREAAKLPTVLFDNMIRPIIPYTARGVIWYQGEANAIAPEEYRVLFPAMITAWRSAWNLPDWPFLFVQLAAFNETRNQGWPDLRAAQSFTRDSLPHTGMALAIDCGAEGNIHPPDKKTVGDRLALLALNQVYGKDLLARGPKASRFENAEGQWRVHFDHVGTGLKSSDGQPDVPAFEVAGSDKVFHKASAKIVANDAIAISCEAVKEPSAVRYAWSGWIEPPVTLQNSASLPAEPFLIQTSASR